MVNLILSLLVLLEGPGVVEAQLEELVVPLQVQVVVPEVLAAAEVVLVILVEAEVLLVILVTVVPVVLTALAVQAPVVAVEAAEVDVVAVLVQQAVAALDC